MVKSLTSVKSIGGNSNSNLTTGGANLAARTIRSSRLRNLELMFVFKFHLATPRTRL